MQALTRLLQPFSQQLTLRLLRRSSLGLTLLAVMVVLAGAFQSEGVMALARPAREQSLLSTVLVLVPDNNGKPYASGSGTILDAADGIILTNFHVMGDPDTKRFYNQEAVAVIGVNPTNLRGAPILKYWAKVVKNGADPKLDLAVLKIVSLFDDQKSALPKNLGLTEAPRGDSDKVMIGDPIYTIGFPGLGGDTVTYTAGTVAGFLDEDNNGVEEWIKTDAEIGHGNSGGLAVNDAGEFVGVPSAGYSDPEAASKIGLIRVGNLALKFLDSALLNPSVGASNGGAQVVAVEFGEAINRSGKILKPQAQFDSGVTDLYASVQYDGFSDGQEFVYTWYADSKKLGGETFEWGGGASGSTWFNTYNDQGLTDGLYELEIRLAGQTLYRGGVSVGKATQPGRAVLSNLQFAANVDSDGRPVKPATSFANVGEVYGTFDSAGIHNGAQFKAVWAYEGQSVLEDESAWNLGDLERSWVSLTHKQGLPQGNYTLQLYLEGELQAEGAFKITERPVKANNVRVTGKVTDGDNKRKTISGALIVFLNPGVLVDDWVNANFDESMILGSATSTRKGEYELDARVLPGESYSVVVLHENYQPVQEDAFQIPGDASDPYVVNISMVAN